MDFIEYTNAWAKSEVLQGKLMIGIGILLSVAFVAIIRSQNLLLKGSIIPLSILLAFLLVYGGYMLYSRPAYAKEIIGVYENSPAQAIKKATEKHETDNKYGRPLVSHIYPMLMLTSVIALIFVKSPYYKGMAIGFLLLFISTFVIDNGFVTRSEAFLSILNNSDFKKY